MIGVEGFSGVRAFVQAQRSGSFAKAAEQLGLSQSAVGKAIARLEDRLGVRLFQRTTRRLALTDEGRAYYDSCLRALAELEAGQAALSERLGAPSGRLRASLPELFGRRKLAPILHALVREHPPLTLELTFENRNADLIEEGLDLAVRIGEPPDSPDLIARRIGEQRLVLCAAPFYLASAPPLTTRADLAQHQRLSQARRGLEDPWLFLDAKGPVERMVVDGRHRFSSMEAIVDAASAGLGVAQAPSWLVEEHLAAGRLMLALPDLPCPGLPILALWPRSRAPAPRIKAAVEALQRGLGQV